MAQSEAAVIAQSEAAVIAQDEALEIIKELATPTTVVRVMADKERLHAYLHVHCGAPPSDVSAEKVMDFLRAIRLVLTPESVSELLPSIESALEGGPPIEGKLCAKGAAPTGRDSVEPSRFAAGRPLAAAG